MIQCKKMNQDVLAQAKADIKNGATVSQVLRSVLRMTGSQPYGVLSDYLSCIYSYDDPMEIMRALDPWCGNFDYGISDEELDQKFKVLFSSL